MRPRASPGKLRREAGPPNRAPTHMAAVDRVLIRDAPYARR